MRRHLQDNPFGPPANLISKSEYVYRSLRDAILAGILKPGTFLNQVELAEQFQMSRMPIRDALTILAKEGLVRNIRHKGANVIYFSLREIQEIYFIRKILEGYAVREAIPSMDAKTLAKLAKINHTLARHAQTGNIDAMIRENEKFHTALYEPCQNRKLLELIQNLWSSYPKRKFWEIKGRGRQVVEQHEKILTAVRARDPEKAQKLIEDHLILSQDIIEHMDSGGESVS